MAERVGEEHADHSGPSAGSRVAAAVRGLGDGTADLTERLARASGAALARAVRDVSRTSGAVVGMTIDGVVTGVTIGRRRRPRRPDAPAGPRHGTRACVDLTRVEDPGRIDEVLAAGLAATAPPRGSSG